MDTLKQLYGPDFDSSPSEANARLLMAISDKYDALGAQAKALAVANEAYNMAKALIESVDPTVNQFGAKLPFGLDLPDESGYNLN